MNGPVDTYAASRDRMNYNNVLASLNPTLAQMELQAKLQLALGRHCTHSGDGILVATDHAGRVFKIEITQVDGPK